jgi:hypothetical protein
MSANSGRLYKGIKVIHEGKEKIVKDWFFTSDPCPNSDVINIRFEDGTGCQGWHIQYTGKEKKEEEKMWKESRKRQKQWEKKISIDTNLFSTIM